MPDRISDRVWGADRAVVYVGDAIDALSELDGDRVSGIRDSAEKFLESPGSAFDKSPRPHVQQVRDLDSNTRAFAVWCQNADEEFEVCIVYAVYKKTNENHYFGEVDEFNNNGQQYEAAVSGMSASRFQQKLDDWAASEDSIVVSD